MRKQRLVRPKVFRSGLVVLVLLLAGGAWADPPRVLDRGEKPGDVRLGELKNLNGYFPFTPPETKPAWLARSEFLKLQLKVATGLWPMPTKTPAGAVIHGRVDRDGYTVDRVYLESFPGHFVTGSLYRPKGRSGRLPGVLCPHGHWADGRFYDAGQADLAKQIASGAEKYDPAGRYPLQARCVQLARMGCVVFHYDMVGYADSVQLGHRPGVRESMNTAEDWGYFSPQAELHLQSMMGLQTYNSIRALDWFEQLPEVDPKRIAVTGASGGGTQTFVLCAIDERPAVAFPAVMVSTAMQGGCTCENACYLRVTEGNIGIAGLIAPRPLGMTGADDWTKEIATKGLPELKALYRLFGCEERVMAEPLIQFPHNYNYPSRAVMYRWMNEHLGLNLADEELVEKDFKPLAREELTVWDAEHPKPQGGDDYERSLLRWITGDAEKRIGATIESAGEEQGEFHRVVGGGVLAMLGRAVVRWDKAGDGQERTRLICPDFASGGDLAAIHRNDVDRDGYRQSTFLIASKSLGEQVPAVLLEPKDWNKKVAVWVSPHGKAGAFSADGAPAEAAAELLDSGMAVLAIDLFGQGEFTDGGEPIASARLVDNGKQAWQQYAGYTYGYNYPVFSKRVHDILSAVAFARGGGLKAEEVNLVGLGGAGRWVAAARAACHRCVHRVAVDTAGFRFAGLTRIDDPDFLPGGAKYLDLPGMLALAAPGEMWLAGEGAEAPPVVAAAYKAHGRPQNLAVFSGPADEAPKAAVAWLRKP